MIVEMNALEEPQEFKDFCNYLKEKYKFSNQQMISITNEIHKLIRKTIKI